MPIMRNGRSSSPIRKRQRIPTTVVDISQYRVHERWKLTASLPCASTLGDASRLINHTMRGRRTFPNGTPIKATKLPAPDAPRAEVLARGFEMISNCAPFDVSGHPAITMPCGLSDGLPAGLMLVGKQFDEMTLYRLASAWESGADGKSIRP